LAVCKNYACIRPEERGSRAGVHPLFRLEDLFLIGNSFDLREEVVIHSLSRCRDGAIEKYVRLVGNAFDFPLRPFLDINDVFRLGLKGVDLGVPPGTFTRIPPNASKDDEKLVIPVKVAKTLSRIQLVDPGPETEIFRRYESFHPQIADIGSLEIAFIPGVFF
jgi:hypothetical protein